MTLRPPNILFGVFEFLIFGLSPWPAMIAHGVLSHEWVLPLLVEPEGPLGQLPQRTCSPSFSVWRSVALSDGSRFVFLMVLWLTSCLIAIVYAKCVLSPHGVVGTFTLDSRMPCRCSCWPWSFECHTGRFCYLLSMPRRNTLAAQTFLSFMA